ncbi:MAG: sodium/proline symporter [Candidatus Marinimicrobia bacterium]|nr:sodium/proline symporter [Candidatus Neomarinimicrobiota bacterium]
MDPVTIGFIIYLILVLAMGLYTVTITRDMKDFALGGHRLGPWVIAFSERASGESAWLLISLPGAALLSGLLELWTVVGCISGIIFSWFVVATRLRLATEKYNVLTIPELFAKKFNDENGLMRLIASLIITFFFTFYVAAQFSGAGKVLNVTFGMTELQGMMLGAVIIVFYTLMGGFLAVAWTDLIQGIIMIGTLVILPVVGWIELTGTGSGSVSLDFSTVFGGNTGLSALVGAIGGLSWGLGYMGQPHLVTRFMAIDKVENIKIGRRIAIAWAIPAFFGSLFIGIVGAGLISNGMLSFNGEILHSVDQLTDPEKLMPLMATSLIHPWLAGIFISGAIAAMMSTADSQLLVTTTVLTEDITKRYFSDYIKINLLTVGRILAVIIGIVAFGMAWKSTNLVIEMVSYAWGGLGAAFGPALVLTLWWKKTSRAGVLAGLVSGTLFTIIPLFETVITPRFSAFFIALICVVVFSVLVKDESKSL